jgi:hypothetical protein
LHLLAPTETESHKTLYRLPGSEPKKRRRA